MALEISIRNRQRSRAIDTRRLRQIASALVVDELQYRSVELGIHLIGARAMAALNWRWLRHEGSTDILTFDEYDLTAPDDTGAGGDVRPELCGELFISVDDAVIQAREFGTTPGAELVRYLVHGVLHLRGFDDQQAGRRRAMKQEENRLLRRLARGFRLRSIVGGPRRPRATRRAA